MSPVPINFCPHCGAPVDEAVKFGKVRAHCLRCGYIHFEDPKVAVAVFVQHEAQILLVKRANDPEKGKWALPAGYVDRGEEPVVAAIRETQEETGLVIAITHLIDVFLESPTIVILYGAVVQSGDLCARDDAEEVRWFGTDDLPDLAFRSTYMVVDRWRTK